MNNYQISVYGTTWGGFKGTLSKKQQFTDDKQAVDMAGHRGYWGDFESIKDYQVIKTTFMRRIEGNKTITTTTEEVIKEFSPATLEALAEFLLEEA